MNTKKIKAKKLLSLRSRYIFVSAVVASFLVVGAIVSSMYVRNITSSNTVALQQQDAITEIIGEIRNSIWQSDMSINAMLISPENTHNQSIKDSLEIAEERLNTLINDKSIESGGLLDVVVTMQSDLKLLRESVQELMVLRKDPNWVYPMLPFISTTLRESHMEFDSSVALALAEIADNDGETHATDLYRRMDEVRDMWRLMILNFREAIIRFAGLNQMDPELQEHNIDYLHERIEKKLSELTVLKKKGMLGFEAEVALEIMKARSKKWYSDFRELKKLRASKIWRADIHFLETNIRPHHDRVIDDLAELEKRVSIWSSRNVFATEQVANLINNGLWLLSALALCFVIFVYIMIDRSVLTPVERIISAISAESGTTEQLYLPMKSSKEIHSLINAFNAMQRQIHHRQLALEHQALHDALTSLPNRALLHDRLDHGMQLANRDGSTLAILLLDLDRFKDINDTLGHPAGDRVLQNVAKRLTDVVRESDTVARLGGDEFAIVLPNTDEEQTKNLTEKIVQSIDQVINIDDHKLYVGVSVGVAFYPNHGSDAATLIRHADIAMYRAKRNNIDYSLFEEVMDKYNVDNFSLLGDLRNEIENHTGQLSLNYQPIVEINNHEIRKVEALLRWRHPGQGYIGPEKIIRMAEQSGLIEDLLEWVLERAIRDQASWNQQGIDLVMSVNLSTYNLQNNDLPKLVNRLLIKHKVKSSKLTLEITEGAVMNDPGRASEILRALNAMGVGLAIDDYGTGFSSLAYLKLLPVQALKIDKSFVIDMLNDENDSIIVRSTIDLAHNLGLKVIAEGVEDHKVLLKLWQLKCDSAQGFYFSEPLAEEQFLSWYRSYKSKESNLYEEEAAS